MACRPEIVTATAAGSGYALGCMYGDGDTCTMYGATPPDTCTCSCPVDWPKQPIGATSEIGVTSGGGSGTKNVPESEQPDGSVMVMV